MTISILWFRQDLRLTDNPALMAAIDSKLPILPIYILDDENAGRWKMGGASRVWLHHSLHALNKSLDGKLLILKGKADEIIPKLMHDQNASAIFWNRCYEPWRMDRDKLIKKNLEERNITVKSFGANLLWEPWTVSKDDGTPYKVFTPFYRRGCLPKGDISSPLTTPQNINIYKHVLKSDDLNLLPNLPWKDSIISTWNIGESGAQKRLKEFLSEGLHDYKNGRDVPSKQSVSRLSPYLHFGEISPRQVWHSAQHFALQHNLESHLDKFHAELGWREFSHYLLYHFNELPNKNWNARFDNFPWADIDQDKLNAWKFGMTGYPMVDAGMRELYATGYMHNRVRMVAASFLVKHLRYHWSVGEDWFWDSLFDADLANNAASWQWVAGTGADAAPYFRIFNPVTQAEKFDADNSYIKKWIPEFGTSNYPDPIIDHKESRDAALTAFQTLKELSA
jgi:deoxyribodipyrimidine photo-lyase